MPRGEAASRVAQGRVARSTSPVPVPDLQVGASSLAGTAVVALFPSSSTGRIVVLPSEEATESKV